MTNYSDGRNMDILQDGASDGQILINEELKGMRSNAIV